jgi:hypothetical protein
VSGPGWMPSRPRPLGQARRLVSYASPHLRRGARRGRAEAAAPPGGVGVVGGAQVDADHRDARPFGSRRAKLPVATLLPHRSQGQPRVMTGALHRWFDHRWMWIQPRLIPLIVAFIGLVGVLNARRYLLELARGPAVVSAAPAKIEAKIEAAADPHTARTRCLIAPGSLAQP